MGPYCKFCGSRCFVPRAGAQLGTTTILATCPRGMAHDLKTSGYTHRTAINPVIGRREELADARWVPLPGKPGFTVAAHIAAGVVTGLVRAGCLTFQSITTLAGVPEAYAVDTHRRSYS